MGLLLIKPAGLLLFYTGPDNDSREHDPSPLDRGFSFAKTR